MKKIISLFVAAALCAGNAMAFDNEPEEGFTFMGLFGMNVSKVQNSGYSAKGGAMLGARADYMLPSAHGAYVTAGLDWTMKGGKTTVDADFTDTDFTEYSGTHKYNLHYLEVPIRVGFRYNIIEELGLYAEVGPYFAIGVGGKHKCSIGDGEEKNQAEDYDTYKAFKNTSYDPTNEAKKTFQRWDAGIGFRIGAEYNKHYNLMLGCDWGLCDMYRNSLRTDYYEYMKSQSLPEEERNLPKVHNFNFSITLGYRF